MKPVQKIANNLAQMCNNLESPHAAEQTSGKLSFLIDVYKNKLMSKDKMFDHIVDLETSVTILYNAGYPINNW